MSQLSAAARSAGTARTTLGVVDESHTVVAQRQARRVTAAATFATTAAERERRSGHAAHSYEDRRQNHEPSQHQMFSFQILTQSLVLQWRFHTPEALFIC
jgi:hypothetical protein